MNKFEMRGIDFQKEAGSKREAVYRMNISCEICSSRGIILDGGCSGCAIRATHGMVMEAFSLHEEYLATKEAAAAREVK